MRSQESVASSQESGLLTPHSLPLTEEIAPDTIVLQLRREMDSEFFHSILGTVLKRIRAFCELYDMEAQGAVLAHAVESDFVKDSKDQEFFILVAIRGANIVGHLLAHMDFYYGSTLAYVHQNEINAAARIDEDQSQLALSLVNDWAKARGATKIKAAALTERHARRLELEYGFKREMILLEKKVV